uniref:Melanin-concentrating hormone n=1 Tax=Scleropages formosus TaxID=113540 RepID=A0A8C9UXZ1_SCLFO
MTLSSFSLIFAAALFSLCCTRSATMAMSKGTLDEVRSERESTNSFPTTEVMNDNSIDAITSNQHTGTAGKYVFTGTMEKCFLQGLARKGNSQGVAPNPTFSRAPIPNKFQDTDAALLEQIRSEGRRDTSEYIPVDTKDFDLLRCMVGRVYRPCWQM